jgi:hypothetical protein
MTRSFRSCAQALVRLIKVTLVPDADIHTGWNVSTRLQRHSMAGLQVCLPGALSECHAPSMMSMSYLRPWPVLYGLRKTMRLNVGRSVQACPEPVEGWAVVPASFRLVLSRAKGCDGRPWGSCPAGSWPHAAPPSKWRDQRAGSCLHHPAVVAYTGVLVAPINTTHALGQNQVNVHSYNDQYH